MGSVPGKIDILAVRLLVSGKGRRWRSMADSEAIPEWTMGITSPLGLANTFATIDSPVGESSKAHLVLIQSVTGFNL